MAIKILSILIILVGFSFGLPTDPILKLDPEIRYALVPDSTGKVHHVDLWLTLDDLQEAARYNPSTDNQYHLFTRWNPTIGQSLVVGEHGQLSASHFNPTKKTFVVVHGWLDSADGDIFQQIVPAILEVEDSNVIVADWNAGGGTINYAVAAIRAVRSGEHIAELINWLMASTNMYSEQFSVFGHSLGGHIAGITARNVNGNVAYVNALDPALPGWATSSQKVRAGDALYTEVIHTNGGALGYLSNLGDVDFYPNGGVNMRGCLTIVCSHNIAYQYFAESIRNGGFSGRSCSSYLLATQGLCFGSVRLPMGGLYPKIGSSGIYHLTTNRRSPYSQG